MNLLNNTFVWGIVRHLLTTVGGALIAQDIATQAQWDTVVAGLMVLIGIVWSMVDKRRRG